MAPFCNLFIMERPSYIAVANRYTISQRYNTRTFVYIPVYVVTEYSLIEVFQWTVQHSTANTGTAYRYIGL